MAPVAIAIYGGQIKHVSPLNFLGWYAKNPIHSIPTAAILKLKVRIGWLYMPDHVTGLTNTCILNLTPLQLFLSQNTHVTKLLATFDVIRAH